MSQSEGELYAVVMAGGKGTRFWPESTSKRPKQYLSLLGGEPLLMQTLKRFDSFIDPDKRFIVTVKEQEELARSCSTVEISPENFIFEPSGRNTAPCILLAMATLESSGAKDSDVLAIVPSDHVIKNAKGFCETVSVAKEAALKDECIVTIGVVPESPHTGFGYIKKKGSAGSVFVVEAFKEKPELALAKEYVASGEYFWNAGMFVASLGTLKKEFASCAPDTFEYYSKLVDAVGDESEVSRIYEAIPKDSIDYAVMEKSKKVRVTPSQFDWNDLGSWDALEGVIESEKGNTLVDLRDSFIEDSSGNIIYAPNKHVSLVGVKDMIVVINETNVVILPKDKSQYVKKIVTEIGQNGDLADLI